jgi:hypothetical protein
MSKAVEDTPMGNSVPYDFFKIFQILNPPTNFHEPSHERYTPEAKCGYFLHSVNGNGVSAQTCKMTLFCTCPVYCSVLSVFACCAVSVIDLLAVDSASE